MATATPPVVPAPTMPTPPSPSPLPSLLPSPDPAVVTGAPGRSSRWSPSSTPARYRTASVVAALVLVAMLLAAATSASALADRAGRVRDGSGPVLVAAQQLNSSLAEADAAAAAVQLSGRTEDREQRRFYEQALERATQQLERVSALVGNDADAHAALQDIAAQLTRYSGLVEQARAENRLGAATANATLASAIDLMRSGIGADVARLTELTEARFADDAARGTVRLVITGAIVVGALLALLATQRLMTRRSRRLVNLPTAVATLLVLGLGVWLVGAEWREHGDLTEARDQGYDAIALSSRVQTTAYRAKADESLALLGAAQTSFANFDTSASQLAGTTVTSAMVQSVRDGDDTRQTGLLFDAGRLADSSRERAAAAETLVRWQTYRNANAAIRAAVAKGDTAGAAAIATTEGNRAFNGVNLSVESLLQDNTEQFSRGLASAHDRLRGLTTATIVVPLLALVLMLWGVQMRIREYR
jgi:CHASE3 domain sensor protein